MAKYNYDLTYLNLEEQLIIYGWFYKLGDPLISDKAYNQLYKKFRIGFPESEVVTKTWSELKEPTELLERVNLINLSRALSKNNTEESIGNLFFLPNQNMEYREKYYQECLEHFYWYVPKSIDTIESIEQTEHWLEEMKGSNETVTLNGSIKIDGWFSELYYYKGYYIGARTRGRNLGDSRDISIPLSHVVPMQIATSETFIRVSCESAMLKSSLSILREMDTTKKWKNHRNSMSTLLTNNLSKNFYKHIVPFALNITGIDFDTTQDSFEFLYSQGFEITPNITVEVSNSSQVISIIEEVSSKIVDIPSDGFVFKVDDNSHFNQHESKGKYDDAIRAFRMFEWKSELYVSIITGYNFNRTAHEIPMDLKILPVPINNNRTVSKLSAGNLDRVLRASALVGSLVAFRVVSDSNVVWIEFSTRYFEKCTEHNIAMEPSFSQALIKFHKFMEDGLGFERLKINGKKEYGLTYTEGKD